MIQSDFMQHLTLNAMPVSRSSNELGASIDFQLRIDRRGEHRIESQSQYDARRTGLAIGFHCVDGNLPYDELISHVVPFNDFLVSL